MVYVVEHGENIGTLRNIFADFQQALVFAEKLSQKAGCSGQQRCQLAPESQVHVFELTGLQYRQDRRC